MFKLTLKAFWLQLEEKIKPPFIILSHVKLKVILETDDQNALLLQCQIIRIFEGIPIVTSDVFFSDIVTFNRETDSFEQLWYI